MAKAETAVDTVDKQGSFKRKESKHRHIISATSDTFKPEPDRYHVYIALGTY